MPKFSTVTEAWVGQLAAAYTGDPRPSRNGPMHEALFTRIVAHGSPVMMHPGRKFSARYACGELLWYLSGSNDIEHIAAYAPSYRRFAQPNGIVAGAYGVRWGNALFTIADLLRKSPDSRQAVLSMWRSDDLQAAIVGITNDIPCTLGIQFLLRDDHLHAMTTMRSNDVWLGTPYDVFCFMCVQRLIADTLGVEVGVYVHQVGSLHLYDEHRERAERALRNKTLIRKYDVAWSRSHLDDVAVACQTEEAARKGASTNTIVTMTKPLRQGTMLYDVTMAACTLRDPTLMRYVINPALRQRLENEC